MSLGRELRRQHVRLPDRHIAVQRRLHQHDDRSRQLRRLRHQMPERHHLQQRSLPVFVGRALRNIVRRHPARPRQLRNVRAWLFQPADLPIGYVRMFEWRRRLRQRVRAHGDRSRQLRLVRSRLRARSHLFVGHVRLRDHERLFFIRRTADLHRQLYRVRLPFRRGPQGELGPDHGQGLGAARQHQDQRVHRRAHSRRTEKSLDELSRRQAPRDEHVLRIADAEGGRGVADDATANDYELDLPGRAEQLSIRSPFSVK